MEWYNRVIMVFLQVIWLSGLFMSCEKVKKIKSWFWCCWAWDVYKEDKDGLYSRFWVSVLFDQDVIVCSDVYPIWMFSHLESNSSANETTDTITCGFICLAVCVSVSFLHCPIVCLRGFVVQWWKCPQTVLCQRSRRGYTSETSSWA